MENLLLIGACPQHGLPDRMNVRVAKLKYALALKSIAIRYWTRVMRRDYQFDPGFGPPLAGDLNRNSIAANSTCRSTP